MRNVYRSSGVWECRSADISFTRYHVSMAYGLQCDVLTPTLLNSYTPKLLAKQSVEGINILFNALLPAINSP